MGAWSVRAEINPTGSGGERLGLPPRTVTPPAPSPPQHLTGGAAGRTVSTTEAGGSGDLTMTPPPEGDLNTASSQRPELHWETGRARHRPVLGWSWSYLSASERVITED